MARRKECGRHFKVTPCSAPPVGVNSLKSTGTKKAVRSNARKNKPDLVIMDMSMPGMNGWEAIRQLKGAADTKAIPIIALTSMTTAEDRDEAYSAGCDAYEAKPIDVQRLEERIKELIG